MRVRTVLMVIVTGGLGCIPQQPEAVEDQVQALRINNPGELWCPTEECGLNSVSVGDGNVFDGLDLRGRTGDEPFWYAGAWIEEGGQRTPTQIAVPGDELVVPGQPVLWTLAEENIGRALILVVRHSDGAEFELRLQQLGGADYLAGLPGSAIGYRFLVRRTAQGTSGVEPGDDELVPLCRGSRAAHDLSGTGVEEWAYVFAGDRYDGSGKRVLPGESTRFHIACSGSALAKMLLFRHTESGQFVWHWSPTDPPMLGNSTLGQRQALLKMFTGDYCGDGQSFTVEGEPLDFAIANDWWKGITPPMRLSGIEAIWGPEGAVCLNEPRHATREEVQAHCRSVRGELPPCTDLENWKARGHVISAHRDPP